MGKVILIWLIAVAIWVICSPGLALVSNPVSSRVLSKPRFYGLLVENPVSIAHWQLPVAEKIPITSCYGPRRLLNKFPDFHEGVDFGARANSPVSAVASGKVIWIGSMGCSGQTVVIQHRIKSRPVVFSLYKHLKKFQVAVGQFVKAGQLIAYSGASGSPLRGSQAADKRGCVSGPHLHVEFKLLKAETSLSQAAKTLRKWGGGLSEVADRANPSRFLPDVKNYCSRFVSSLDSPDTPITKLNYGKKEQSLGVARTSVRNHRRGPVGN